MASSGILPASSQLAMPAFQTCICGVSWPLRTSSCNCTGLNGPAGCPLIETCQATCGIGGGVIIGCCMPGPRWFIMPAIWPPIAPPMASPVMTPTGLNPPPPPPPPPAAAPAAPAKEEEKEEEGDETAQNADGEGKTDPNLFAR